MCTHVAGLNVCTHVAGLYVCTHVAGLNEKQTVALVATYATAVELVVTH